MTPEQQNELYKRAQVIKAKCDEFIKYGNSTNEAAFALGIELLASGQLFTETAGHACQPATGENHLMFGIKMTKDESAIISLILKQMHDAFPDSNSAPQFGNKILLDSALYHANSIIEEIRKDDADLYDVNTVLIKAIARLLYAAMHLDLTQDLTVNKTDASAFCLPSRYEGC